mmetsp:Transcript_14872/g.19618  ORF Transcript_14872/g.19618 Transcript_14872/m.19618 type:complete len:274 (+) Transcript_14872:133-954(+)
MVLYLIGLGLGDEKDITVKGLETIQRCSKVFLEHYTSMLGVGKEKLEEFYGREIILADRDICESQAETIYKEAKDEDIAFIVVGDPLCATTHTDLIIRAREENIPVEVIHNASVMGAAASCGLQLYHFGQTVSIPFFTDDWRPDSFYEKIKVNKEAGMHTLCLLDIKVKEPDFEQMARGKIVYLPPRFMSVATAAEQLLEVEQSKNEGICSADTLAVGLARLGQPNQLIIAGKLSDLATTDFGEPLHSLVICGELHPLEQEMLKLFMANTKEG